MNREGKKIQRLTVSGIFIALATILSLIRFAALPYGGTVTAFSMLPIVMLGYMYGARWGVVCGVAYGAIQAVIGAATSAAFAGQSAGAVLGVLALDYLVAFGVLGLSGMFRRKIKKAPLSFALGSLIAGLLRYFCHFVSGFIIFGSYAEWFFTLDTTSSFGPRLLSEFSGTALAMVYSLIYNGTYMIPEIIGTVVLSAVIISVKPIKKLMES